MHQVIQTAPEGAPNAKDRPLFDQAAKTEAGTPTTARSEPAEDLDQIMIKYRR